MSNLRQNYIEAREIIANELKEKYNLVETINEYDCLTLDSNIFSIHLTFIVPDGDEVFISEKGKQWFNGKSFKDLLFEKYPIDSERLKILNQIFNGTSRHPYSYETVEIISSFRAKLNFIEDSLFEIFI
jgi:hypothetical protein